eukprot:jgi/Chlat1/9058/Chrsp94S08315
MAGVAVRDSKSRGKSHDRYVIGDEIGRGAYGKVYKGTNTHDGSIVAIKQVSLENVKQSDLAGIMVEIDLLKASNLNHKNIVKYLGSYKTSSHLYIILEYVENGSLANMIKPSKFGALSESLVALYTAQILEGLVYLHEQGVIHRDIKGANILTTKEGLVKLADFGVATKLTEAEQKAQQSKGTSVVGSPYWMAPEVIVMSGVSAASDIWGVGCTVIELLTGAPPYFEMQHYSALFHIVQDPKERGSAKKLLRHPWIRQNRRALQNSISRHTGRLQLSLPRDIDEEVETVVAKSIQLDANNLDNPIDEPDEVPVSMSQSFERASSLLPLDRPAIPPASSHHHNHQHHPTAPVPTTINANGHARSFTDPSPTSATPPVHKQASLTGQEASSSWKELTRRHSASKEDDTLSSKSTSSASSRSMAAAFVASGGLTSPDSSLRQRSAEWRLSSGNLGEQQQSAGAAGDNQATFAATESSPFPPVARTLTEAEVDGLDLDKTDNYAQQTAELSKILFSLGPDAPEGIVLGSCQQLLRVLRDNADMKGYLIAHRAITPLIEMLDSDNTNILLAALQVVNFVITDNATFQENVCLLGLIPMVMRFLDSSYSKAVRLQAAAFMRQICCTGTLTLQLFVACQGIPVLVKLLETDPDCRDMLYAGIDGIWQVFRVQTGISKGETCKLLTKAGMVERLVDALASFNDNRSRRRTTELITVLDAVTNGEGHESDLKSWKLHTAAYAEKVANILLVLAHADASVRTQMYSTQLLHKLFKQLSLLEPAALVKVLRVLRQLSLDANALESLHRGGAILHLVPLLDHTDHLLAKEVSTEVLQVLFHLCACNRARLEQAASAGIVPVLTSVASQPESPLLTYAVPLLCELAHVSKSTRSELWRHNGHDVMLDLLRHSQWQSLAMEALAVWLLHEPSRVEQRLLQADAIQALIGLFEAGKAVDEDLLESFLRIISKSKRLNVSMSTSGRLMTLLTARMHSSDNFARIALLKTIKILYEQHPNPRQFMAENDVTNHLRKVVESEKDTMNVLVRQTAKALLESMLINKVY